MQRPTKKQIKDRIEELNRKPEGASTAESPNSRKPDEKPPLKRKSKGGLP